MKRDALSSQNPVADEVEEDGCLFDSSDHNYTRNEWHVIDSNHDYFRRPEQDSFDDDVEHSYAFSIPRKEMEEVRSTSPKAGCSSNQADPYIPCVCQWANCFFVADDSDDLETHIEKHVESTQRKCLWFRCRKAENVYKHRYLLMRHIRSHTGSRPFSCEHCSQAFKTKERLCLHVRALHECEVKYRCELCDAFFKTTSDRSHHVRRVHEKFKVRCPNCGSSLAGPAVLRRHLAKCAPDLQKSS